MQTHRVDVEFEGGHLEHFEVPAGTDVLSAARHAGLPLASQCESGSCGTCIARVVEGEAPAVQGRATALLPSEFEAGGRLLCSTLVETDARFEIPYPIDVLLGPQPKTYRAVVREIEVLSQTVRLVRVELDRRARMDYRPGQYARLRIPGSDEWRSYSMANPVDQGGVLEFIIRMLPDGSMSDYLRDRVTTGDDIEVDGPYGSFVLRESKGHHLFVAGGTGLAPILAMLDTIRKGRGRGTKMTLCFACATESDLYYEDEIGLRKAWVPNLTARVAVTYPSNASYAGRIGSPVDLIEAEDVLPDTLAYLCGPPRMIEAARARLLDLGMDEDRIHSELFLASPV